MSLFSVGAKISAHCTKTYCEFGHLAFHLFWSCLKFWRCNSLLCMTKPNQFSFYRGLEIRKPLSSLFEFSPTHIDLRYDGFPSVKNALYFFVTGFRYSTKGLLYTGNLVFSGCYFSYFYILWENVGQFVKPS